ncbi:MAG: O-antigen ligase family protein [Bacteroidota bacterium]|nr:O-antigen ligase family protein [Bacteroidota bacterium]MDX5429517.1 O-antigen ligase family protein [Bacteroidota bacterium]MDX5468302.1 O-antigen ligase family protein [Bacteroidota bacterium]
MIGRSSLNWFYSLGIGFVAATVVGVIYDIYLLYLIPAAIAVGLLAFFKADRLIMLTAFLVPLSVTIQDLGFGAGLIMPTEPIIILVMFVAILKLCLEGVWDKDFIRHPVTIAILINTAWLLLTAATSTMPVVSFKFFISRVWYIIVFYFFASHMFHNIKRSLNFIWLFLMAAVLVVTYIMILHSTHGFSRDAVFVIIQPFFWIHGVYAAMVALLIPVLFVLVWKGKEFAYSPLRRSFLLFFAVFFVAAVIFSYTRAAWLSVIAAAVAYVVFSLRVKLSIIYTAVMVAVFAGIYFQGDIMMKLSRNKTGSNSKNMEKHLQSATNIRNDPSNLERINRWSCAWRMFQDKPVFGFGPGTYMFQYAPYQLSYQKTVISTNFATLGHAHSEWLGPLAETGLIGMLSWFAVFVVVFIRGLYLIYYAIDPKIRYLSLALVLALLTYFVHGFLNSYFDYDKIAVPFWAFISILVSMDLQNKKAIKQMQES